MPQHANGLGAQDPDVLTTTGTSGRGPGAADAPRISVCITTRGRSVLLDSCLTALAAQVGAPPFELLVCCQGDASAAPIVRSHFPEATVGMVEKAYPGGARNFLVGRARGELLVFLDDDVTFSPDLLCHLGQAAELYPTIGVFGGPNLTPPGSTLFQIVSGAILGSALATGPVRRRYGRHAAGVADERFFTLCNMAIRRDVMTSFPPSLSGGEENAVLHELATRHVPMRYDPGLFVFHERRATSGGFATQMEKYGRGRGQVVVRHPGSTRTVHLLPIALVAWLISLPVVAVCWTPWYLLGAGFYAVGLLASGAAVAAGMGGVPVRKRVTVTLLGAALTSTVHVCYGVGMVRGLVRRRRTPASQWSEVTAGTGLPASPAA
jgi:cellulose synthase/poly-beta-1,6-N-acetylglucosamine synthase-like glycosyltransferase